MNRQPKDNTGALFPNKSDNPKAPAFKGKVLINGTELDIAGWSQTSQKGQKYISLKFSAPFKKSEDADEAF